MTVTCLVEKQLSCDGSKDDAALKVSVAGGKPPYSYKWESALQGDNPQKLGPGLYLVTVSDSDGKSKIAKAKTS